MKRLGTTVSDDVILWRILKQLENNFDKHLYLNGFGLEETARRYVRTECRFGVKWICPACARADFLVALLRAAADVFFVYVH